MSYRSRVDKNVALSQPELDNNFLCHYPVGSIYMNALSDESPGKLIGYGTWTKFAQGYTLQAANSPRLHGDTGFDLSPREYAETLPVTSGSGTFVGSENAGNQTDGYYSPGFTGGEPTILVDDYPKHSHKLQDTTGPGNSIISGEHRGRSDYNGFYFGGHNNLRHGSASICRIGGGSLSFGNNATATTGHNNIQKYITISIWKRDS